MNFFAKNKIIIGLAILCISLLSCGKDIPCDDAISTLNFISFPDSETDTIILRRFNKSTNFTAPIDTFFLNNLNSSYSKSHDTLEIGNPFKGDNGLKSKYDYEIYIPQTSRLFILSDIVEEFSQTKGGGLFSMDKRGCINTIKSYKLNGQLISGEYNYYRFYMKR